MGKRDQTYLERNFKTLPSWTRELGVLRGLQHPLKPGIINPSVDEHSVMQASQRRELPCGWTGNICTATALNYHKLRVCLSPSLTCVFSDPIIREQLRQLTPGVSTCISSDHRSLLCSLYANNHTQLFLFFLESKKVSQMCRKQFRMQLTEGTSNDSMRKRSISFKMTQRWSLYQSGVQLPSTYE